MYSRASLPTPVLLETCLHFNRRSGQSRQKRERLLQKIEQKSHHVCLPHQMHIS